MRKLMTLLVMAILTTSIAIAQNRVVKGKVTDDKGLPIANASVVAKGSGSGTTTKDDGSFTLNVDAKIKSLLISALNFALKEVNIGAGDVSVSLVPTSGTLEEVVINVPYRVVKKATFTGSEGSVGAATIEKQNNTSITRALDGQIAGVSSTSGGGTPGSGANVVIRGFGSINANSSPLYVLNGVPYDGSISALSTDDIESISVLKDAAAANLYGSRAANGVIMLTTKTGRKGRAAVTATMRYGQASRAIPEYSRLGTKDYYEVFWEAFRNSYYYGSGQTKAAAGVSASNVLTSPTGLVYNAYNVPGATLVDPVTGKLAANASLLWNEQWSDELFQNAARTNPTINISGANDKTDYFISGSYLDEQGTAKFSGYKRYTIRTSVNTQATDWLKAGLSIDGASDLRDGLFAGGTATSNPFYYSRQMGPIYPVYQHNLTTGAIIYDAAGKPVFDFGTPQQMGARPYAANSNLLGTLSLDVRKQRRVNGNFNTYGEIKFLRNFTFRSNFALNYFGVDGTTYQNNQYGDAAGVKGRSTVSFTKSTSLTLNQVLSYNKDFGKHNVSVLAGHENYEYITSNLSATKTGFAFPNQTALSNASTVESPPTSSEDKRTIESYFASANYTFDDKYLLSGSARRDGSSRFALDTRWGTFYSAGLGWVASKESFLKDVKWLDYLKFRGSYGESGNDDIGLYYQYVNYYYADGLGNYGAPTNLSNPSLKWEANANLSYGVEFTAFKKRLTGSFEMYDRRSKDLLFLVPLAPQFGLAGGVWQNIGELKNKGVELQLGYQAVRTKNFDWKIDFNVFKFKNELLSLPPTQTITGIVTGNKKYTIGKSIYDFWLREFAGVDPATGLSLYYQDVLGTDGKPNGNRVLTSDGAKASFYYVGGSSIPKFQGGMTNSFRYKNIDLSVLVSFSYGGKYYDGNYGGIMSMGAPGIAWSSDILNRWQKPGDVTNVPRVQTSSGQDYASSRFLFDASYVNIKNINLGYKLPTNVARRLFLNDLRVFASVDNLKLFTAKEGGDPQQDFGGNPGSTYPLYRTVTIGLTVKL
ncbi:MAG: SusC/RagA family TonB-linked outer membrane protein [Chitinophagaceae bacterium]